MPNDSAQFFHDSAFVGLFPTTQTQSGLDDSRNASSHPRYGDLRHYSVEISQSPPDGLPLEYAREECVRVYFVPDFSAKDYREHIVGGRTSFGIEVNYDISKRTLKIVKTSFAR
jgi:hypothetical protein